MIDALIADDSALTEPPAEALTVATIFAPEDPPPEWLSQLHADLEVIEVDGGGNDSANRNTNTNRRGGAASLADALDRTETRGGRALFRRMLTATPSTDMAVLGARRAVLSRLLQSPKLGVNQKGGAGEEGCRGTEADVLWFFRLREDEALSSLVSSAYFDVWPLTLLNRRSPTALAGRSLYNIAVSPLVGLLSPIAYFVVPYIVLVFSGKGDGAKRIGFVEYLRLMLRSFAGGGDGVPGECCFAPWVRRISALFSLLVYFHSVISNVQAATALRSVSGSVGARVVRATAFLRDSARRCEEVGWSASDASAFSLPYSSSPGTGSTRDPQSASDDAAVFFQWRAPLATARETGRRLRDAAAFDLVGAASTLRLVYGADAVMSIARASRDMGLAVVDFIASNAPTFAATGLRHPCIKGAVGNDWTLGGSKKKRNALLTGPNAGGKSTLIKSALLSAMTAQTIGVAACASLLMTPFSAICSHLNVSDRAGSESLFQAEMARAHRVVRLLDATTLSSTSTTTSASPIDSSSFVLVALDEVFSSTNPSEGMAAAAAVAARIGACERAICIVSTHYPYLCKRLASPAQKKKEGAVSSYAAYGMPVDIRDDRIDCPYVLRRGACRQHLALELMRRSGLFDAALVDDAICNLATIHRPRAPPPVQNDNGDRGE